VSPSAVLTAVVSSRVSSAARPFDSLTAGGPCGVTSADVDPRAGGVDRNPPATLAGDAPANGSPALQPLHARDVEVRVLPPHVARALVVRHHYLHSWPGATRLCFGVFADGALLGVCTLGAGSINGHCLVEGATRADVWTLSRLWLDDRLPRNTESRVLGIVVRALRRFTRAKAVVAYADPGAHHRGTIYQAAGWLYTGPSGALPRLDLGDGIPRHCRSVGSLYGTHSVRYLRARGLPVCRVPQASKHTYLVVVDPAWRDRIRPASRPYPKEANRGDP